MGQWACPRCQSLQLKLDFSCGGCGMTIRESYVFEQHPEELELAPPEPRPLVVAAVRQVISDLENGDIESAITALSNLVANL